MATGLYKLGYEQVGKVILEGRLLVLHLDQQTNGGHQTAGGGEQGEGLVIK